MRILGLVLLFILAAGITHAFIFVDQASCSDSYSKEQAQNESTPFCTIDRAASVATAGDTVLIKTGTYVERVTVQNSGTADDWITFKAYPGHKAVLDGTGNAGWHGIFSIYGKRHIRLDGIEIKNNNVGWGVLIDDDGSSQASSIQLVGLDIHRTSGEQIQVRGNVRDVLIENCTVHDSTGSSSGIDIYQYDGRPGSVIVRGCTAYNIPGFACIASEQADELLIENNLCYDSKMGIDIGSGRRNIVRNNLVHDIGTGIMLSSNTDSEVYNNTVYNVAEEALYNYCWSAHGEEHARNAWHNNVIHDAALGIYESFRKKNGVASCPSTGHVYRNNLFYNIGSLNWRSPFFFEGVSDLRFDQNTVVMNNNYDAIEFLQTTGEAKNNIISVSQASAIRGTIDADFNLYHNRAGQATGPGANSVTGDPLFISPADGNFRVRDESPACGAGDSMISHDMGAFRCGDNSSCIPMSTAELKLAIYRWHEGHAGMATLLAKIAQWKEGCG